MRKVCIVGHFAYGKDFTDGQTVKTYSVDKALREIYGDSQVDSIDTHGVKKRFFAFAFSLIKALRTSENILILPAHNGVTVIAPILRFFNKFYHRRLHYSVVGGWLPMFLEKRPKLEKMLKTFDGIYVETKTMQTALCEKGFENVFLVPNFKALETVTLDSINIMYHEPYRLCTFSRVMRQKGIEDAIEAIKYVNGLLGRVVFNLDIYGPIDTAEAEWFDELTKDLPKYVTYKGVVAPDKSVEVLKDYFALLFPTRFYTEGVPGTIIDAYAAGVPVISSRWESFADVVDDGVSGISYEFGDVEALKACLVKIAKEPESIISKKNNCIKKALEFTPESALGELLARM